MAADQAMVMGTGILFFVFSYMSYNQGAASMFTKFLLEMISVWLGVLLANLIREVAVQGYTVGNDMILYGDVGYYFVITMVGVYTTLRFIGFLYDSLLFFRDATRKKPA